MIAAALFLEELVGVDLLVEELEQPATELAADLRRQATALSTYGSKLITSMHPLVRCPDCESEYTACDAGNHYCPSCGESCEGAEVLP